MPTQYDDELLDLVDENDHVVGSEMRSEVYRKDELNRLRGVWLFIENSKKELWIPRRAPHKAVYPSSLDASVTGHVASGETYREAIIRETMEELRIDLSKTDYKLLGKLNPFKHGNRAFASVFKLVYDEVPNYNRDDFTDFFWMTPAKLLEAIDGGETVKSTLPVAIRMFFGDRL